MWNYIVIYVIRETYCLVYSTFLACACSCLRWYNMISYIHIFMYNAVCIHITCLMEYWYMYLQTWTACFMFKLVYVRWHFLQAWWCSVMCPKGFVSQLHPVSQERFWMTSLILNTDMSKLMTAYASIAASGLYGTLWFYRVSCTRSNLVSTNVVSGDLSWSMVERLQTEIGRFQTAK